jgi:ribose-phosphate pyrophosphokinase
MEGIKIFSNTPAKALTTEICEILRTEPSRQKVKRFADGEVFAKIDEGVRNSDTFLIVSLQTPSENRDEMRLLAESIRSSCAERLIIIVTYMGYNRQDRRSESHMPIGTLMVFRDICESRPDHVMTLDAHSEQSLIGFRLLNVVFDNLFASYVLLPKIRSMFSNGFVIATPDKGGGGRAMWYYKHLDLRDYVMFAKERPAPGEIDGDRIKIIGDVSGQDVVFVDDLIDSAKTIVNDAEAAKKAGAKDIYVFATHGVFSDGAIERIEESSIKKVVVTNSVMVPDEELAKSTKIERVSIAPLIAETIRRFHNKESFKTLFI